MFFPAKQITREIQLHWMYSLRLLTYQLGSGNTTCGITTYVCNIKIWIFVNRALTIVESKCVTFQFIYQLIWQFECSSWFSSHSPDKSSSLGRNAWRLEQDFAPRQEPVAALHGRSVLCYFSHLTEDNGEIYMNTGVVELHNSLWNQIFLNPLQLGLFSAIFCHHCLFVEFMSKVPVLVIVQRTPPGKNKRCCISGTFETCQRLLVPLTGCIPSSSTAWERPDTFGFGSTSSHPQR